MAFLQFLLGMKMNQVSASAILPSRPTDHYIKAIVFFRTGETDEPVWSRVIAQPTANEEGVPTVAKVSLSEV